MSEEVADEGDHRHINYDGKANSSTASEIKSKRNGEEFSVSITQKMLSAVSGSVLTSILGTTALCFPV